MMDLQEKYQAFINRNTEYDGIFFAGIKTTGIFCRPACSARKPRIENCDFFTTAQDAMLAGYRPCKRCHPLAPPDEASELIQVLIEAVEAEPEKRWTDADFRALGADTSTVRRQFKKRFGMTFVAYARARRMGLALGQLRNGGSVIEAQLDAGYESGSGFRDAFSRIMGNVPSMFPNSLLKADWIDTLLGPMIAIADDDRLYLLEFTDRKGLEREIERMRHKLKTAIVPGKTAITHSISKELTAYFKGDMAEFTTPVALDGSDFQENVWQELQKIPYGTTMSYTQLARNIGRASAARAVARANGTNQLAIIVPCHRIINANEELGGYSGGIARKKWLISHEKKHADVFIGYSYAI